MKVAKTPDSFILQINNVFGAHVMYISKWKWSLFTRIASMDNGLFFFERCSLITATVCAYKLNNALTFVCTHRAVIRLHLWKKKIYCFMFTFLKKLWKKVVLIFLHQK